MSDDENTGSKSFECVIKASQTKLEKAAANSSP